MISSEEWMVLPGYSNYFISDKGNVKRIRKIKRTGGVGLKEIHLKSRNINGYSAVTLINDSGIKKTVYLHKAIATCFVSKPLTKAKLIVVHKDGDKANNNVDNLVWRSYSEFMQTEFDTGRRSNKDLWLKRVNKYGAKGSSKPNFKRVNLSKEDIDNIYYLYHVKHYTLKKLSEKYNCSISHIFNLLQRSKTLNQSG